MVDLIVFSVDKNKYSLNIDNVVRIIQAINLTEVPNAHELIDGIMPYENNVIKVLNFRRLIGLESHKEDINEEENYEYEQKLIFFENLDDTFAIKVDKINDIAHIEESDIMSSDEDHNRSEFLDISGVLDLDGVLINVIKELRLPK